MDAERFGIELKELPFELHRWVFEVHARRGRDVWEVFFYTSLYLVGDETSAAVVSN